MIVVPKTSASSDNPWFGLAIYAWSGCVLHDHSHTLRQREPLSVSVGKDSGYPVCSHEVSGKLFLIFTLL